MVRYGQRHARRNSRLRRRFIRRHNGHPPVLNRLRLPRQRQRHLLAIYKTPLQVLNAAEARSSASARPRKKLSFFANSASKWAFTKIPPRSSTKTAKQPSPSLTRHASENAQSTLPSAGTLSLSVKTLRSPTSKSFTGDAPRCSLTSSRHHAPLRLLSRFAITSSDTSPRS